MAALAASWVQPAAADQTVYQNDFEGGDVSGWSTIVPDNVFTGPIAVSHTPVGSRAFLGEFGRQPVWLSVPGLAPHVKVRVAFDLYVIRSWDGNGDNEQPGPDVWGLSVAGESPTLVATFCTTGLSSQTYPDPFYGTGDPRNSARSANTGAEEVDTLGYSHFGDAVYHIEFEIAHSATDLVLEFSGDGLQELSDESWGLDNVTVALVKDATSLYAADRTGTITENVGLRGYLKRSSDNAWLDGKTIVFRIDGTTVGTAVTGALGTSGRADLNWPITPGPATRTITAAFDGDPDYGPSSGNAKLTAQSWTTKMVVFARTARITDRTELKARLLRSDNAPLYGKTIAFYIDRTFIINRNTNTHGYASYPNYDVPDGAGAGVRTIRADWAGNAGYSAISRETPLTVLKTISYIWVLSKSVPQGGIADLYSYFRRLYNYRKQENKPVTFRIDRTWTADVHTGTGSDAGVAR